MSPIGWYRRAAAVCHSEQVVRIAILGMGAVGGYFGGRLVEAGLDVVFLVRDASQVPERSELELKSPLGDWRGRVELASVSDQRVRPDVIVIATKAFDFQAARAAVAPLTDSGTRIVPLLNGVRHLDELGMYLPRAVPAGGLAHLMVSREHSRIVHANRLHRFRFGPLAGGSDEVLAELGRLARHANMDAAASADIRGEMWAKFQMLAAFSALCCLTRATAGGIVATDNGSMLMARALAETARVAAAEGYPCGEAHLTETERLLTEPGSPFSASMLRDIEARRPTEADHILGDMVRRGRRHGLDLPILECAWAALQVYEACRPPRGSRIDG
jgi:2-dehydropantoate 2-reductase